MHRKDIFAGRAVSKNLNETICAGDVIAPAQHTTTTRAGLGVEIVKENYLLYSSRNFVWRDSMGIGLP